MDKVENCVRYILGKEYPIDWEYSYRYYYLEELIEKGLI